MASDLVLPEDLANGTYSWGAVYNNLRIRETKGRSGNESSSGSASAQRVFIVTGTYDPVAARAALVDGPVLIDTFDGMFRENIEWDQGETPDSWIFTVRYSYVPAPGRYTVSIDTNGGAILQTSAFAQAQFAASGETAIDFGKSIDVQDGNPQGVERVIPALKINVNARISADYTDEDDALAYAKIIANVTGYMASGTFMTFAAGELLFIGASGDIIGENPTLNFSFLASPNLTSKTIGDITGVNKLGHDYLWFDFKRYKDATTKMPSAKPRAAYVGRIYDFADMSVLKIGDV